MTLHILIWRYLQIAGILLAVHFTAWRFVLATRRELPGLAGEVIGAGLTDFAIVTVIVFLTVPWATKWWARQGERSYGT
jgi:cobalamin synthase